MDNALHAAGVWLCIMGGFTFALLLCNGLGMLTRFLCPPETYPPIPTAAPEPTA